MIRFLRWETDVVGSCLGSCVYFVVIGVCSFVVLYFCVGVFERRLVVVVFFGRSL